MPIAEKDMIFLKSLSENAGFISTKDPEFLKKKLFDIKITMLLWTDNEQTKDVLRREIFHLYDNLSDDEIMRLYWMETIRIEIFICLLQGLLPHRG